MITIKVDNDILKQIKDDYEKFITEENIGYILFSAKKENNIITAYTNKKNQIFKVTIQGDDCLEIANKYSKTPIILSKKSKPTKDSLSFIDVDEQIGSDEVGTGDFLAPIVVCAAYVDHNTMKIVDDLGVKDSKKFTDKQILEIVPLIIKKVYFEYKILSNERYNAAIKNGFNMNKIKTILHNACLTTLRKRFPCVNNIYVDQFVDPKIYFDYLGDTEKVTEGIVFMTKGESLFPSVALASCIARYLFLKEVEYLSNKIGVKIALGAGLQTDDCARKIIGKIGFKDFAKLCKQNFKNFEELTKNELF